MSAPQPGLMCGGSGRALPASTLATVAARLLGWCSFSKGYLCGKRELAVGRDRTRCPANADGGYGIVHSTSCRHSAVQVDWGAACARAELGRGGAGRARVQVQEPVSFPQRFTTGQSIILVLHFFALLAKFCYTNKGGKGRGLPVASRNYHVRTHLPVTSRYMSTPMAHASTARASYCGCTAAPGATNGSWMFCCWCTSISGREAGGKGAGEGNRGYGWAMGA